MRVRLARGEDREPLLELWERSVRATHDFLSAADVTALRPLVAEALASDAVDWWVLLEDGETPIGFLGYSQGSIEALFVNPDHQGRGGGKFLVAHAQSLSGGALAVDVNEQNEAARRFYSAMGFSVVGRSPTDTGGRPFPLLHMARPRPARSDGGHSHSTQRPRVTSFAPQFLVDDLARSIAYYERLGFVFGEPWDGFYAIGRLDGLELHLKEAPKYAPERQHRRENEHLDAAAGVEGIEAFYAHCTASGVTILRPLTATAWGTLDFYVEDPDGYVVCFGGRPTSG